MKLVKLAGWLASKQETTLIDCAIACSTTTYQSEILHLVNDVRSSGMPVFTLKEPILFLLFCYYITLIAAIPLKNSFSKQQQNWAFWTKMQKFIFFGRV